jgi:large subunit ribosomal protein L25
MTVAVASPYEESRTVSEVRIAAEPRTEFGKGGARRTRRAGKVPAVLYGHGQQPRHIALPARELMHAFKGGANVLLTLELDGGTQLALPKDVQRDPLKGTLDHVDLLLVRRGEKVTVDVPVHLVGDAASETLVNQEHTTLSVLAEATHIPTAFDLSIDGLEVGQTITASQVELPSGVTLVTDPDAVVVGGLAAPTAAQLEAELETAEAEIGAGAAAAEEPAAEAAAEGAGAPGAEGASADAEASAAAES